MNTAYTIIGTHAGETIDKIFDRKINDINTVGHTYWLFHSSKVSKDVLTKLVPTKIMFLLPKIIGSAKPTKSSTTGNRFISFTNNSEISFNPLLSPVTGKISNKSIAFKLSNITLISDPYKLYLPNNVTFNQFAGTIISTDSNISSINYRYCVGCGDIIDCGYVRL